MAKCRVLYINNLKGILIILVVVRHFFTSLSDSHLTLTICNFIYAFHMPLFLFCSGLFAARSLRSGGHSSRWRFALFAFVPVVLHSEATSLLRKLSTGLHAIEPLEKTTELSIAPLVAARLLHYGLVALLGICIAVLTPQGHSFLTTVGERSLQVYIFHLLIMYIAQRLLTSSCWESRLGSA